VDPSTRVTITGGDGELSTTVTETALPPGQPTG